jgi:hypothetical protein
MFSYITRNWCGRMLCSLEMIVNLIVNTMSRVIEDRIETARSI